MSKIIRPAQDSKANLNLLKVIVSSSSSSSSKSHSVISLSVFSFENLFLIMSASTLRNLKKYVFNTNTDFYILLCAQEAVDDEVNRAVDNEEEVLDGSEAEHPAGVGGEHAQAPAQVGPLTYS